MTNPNPTSPGKAEELLALASRCEAAEGPDRELDALIRCAAFAPEASHVEQSPFNGAWIVYHGAEARSGRPRVFEKWPSNEVRLGAFTASLDAAMQLVPEGWGWGIITYGREGIEPGEITANCTKSMDDRPTIGTAATTALALCAASLKARAHTSGERG